MRKVPTTVGDWLGVAAVQEVISENMSADPILSPTDLAALVESGKELTSEINPSDLVNKILVRAGQLTDSLDGAVFLYDRERDGLYFAAALGTEASTLLDKWGASSNQRVPLRGSKAGAVFESGKPIVVDSAVSDPEHYKGVDEQTQHKTESMLSVPLTHGTERIGVIQLLNKRTGNYTPRDRALLEHFAGQAAVALRNARLFRDLLAHMGLYSARDAVDLVTQLNKPARMERLTLLFADMHGFVQLCHVLNSPDQTQRLLNDFLTMLSEQIIQHGGIVNKYLGDGVLGFFRQSDTAKAAVKCAFSMVQRFESLLSRWNQESNEELGFLDIGIGIATDKVIIGTIGSASVRDFTVIGTAVNLAAAFEKEARGGRRILVDQTTWFEARDLVADAHGPVTYEFRKSDQKISIPYKQYSLHRLRPDKPTRVFISHNHRDRQFVERELTEALTKYGIDTWYSSSNILPGTNYVEAIQAGLLKCDWVVVAVSQHSASSDWVAVEVQTAFADPRLANKIIPVTLDDTDPVLISDGFRVLQRIDARKERSVAEQLYIRFTASG